MSWYSSIYLDHCNTSIGCLKGNTDVAFNLLSSFNKNDQSVEGEEITEETGHSPKEQPFKKGQDFRKEFKTAANEVKSKLSSKMEFDAHIISTRKVHVLFTHTQTNGLRVAAIVDIRNVQRLDDNTIDRLCCLRNVLLERGYHRVSTYVYVNEHTQVSSLVENHANDHQIKVVNKRDLNPCQFVIQTDDDLRRLTHDLSPGTDDTDSAGSYVHDYNHYCLLSQ